jgi:hypothetical protein
MSLHSRCGKIVPSGQRFVHMLQRYILTNTRISHNIYRNYFQVPSRYIGEKAGAWGGWWVTL